MCAQIYSIKDGEEIKPHQKLIDQSYKNHEQLEETIRLTKLYSQKAHVTARETLYAKHKSLDLSKEKHKELFSEEFAKELYKTIEPEIYKELGVSKPEKGKSPSKKFMNMILESYQGVNTKIISDLIDEHGNDFITVYDTQIAPKHQQRLREKYTIDAHEHLSKASEKDRKAIIKNLGLEGLLTDAGIGLLSTKDYAPVLGQLIHRHGTTGLSRDYLEKTELSKYLVDKIEHKAA